MSLQPLPCCFVLETVRSKDLEGSRSNGSVTILSVEVRPHARDDIAVVVVVAAIHLVREQRQELVEAALSDPDLCPRISVGILLLAVLHHNDARLASHVPTGCLRTSRWVEAGMDQLFQ